MTSEIAVMNQRAVALAADTAVTLVDDGTVVVRNEQQKLFNLADGHPIAIMFFGVADMLGHPWDHLVEHYQTKHRRDALKPRVRDYAAAFTGMLDHLDEFFPPERQREDYRRLLASVFRHIFAYAQFLRQNSEDASLGADDTRLLESAIERIWREYQVHDDGAPRRDLPCFPQGFGKIVASRHAAQINELIDYGFRQFGISKQAEQHLHDIAAFCVTKDLFLEDVSGLVFAGFGSQERYPSVVTYYVSAVVDGIVKRSEVSVDVIDNEIRSRVRIFADSEVTHAFLRGIDFNLERRLYAGFRMLLHGVVDEVIAVFRAPEAQKKQVRERFQTDFVPRYFDAFRGMIGEYQQHAFINPVLRVLEIAGKKELAETARSLVELNVFKKRIMAQKETVGGAIDVAVISRDSGFQWVAKPGAA
ncbi:MAG: hypothetical protein ACT4OG_00980 [Alphaproteobacteria bacterium]